MADRITSESLRSFTTVVGSIGSSGICTDDPDLVSSKTGLPDEVESYLIAAGSALPAAAILAIGKMKSSSESSSWMLLGFCLVISISSR